MTFDIQRLKDLAAAGLIYTQQHPTEPLLIHNYTARCQYDKRWDEYTLAARGLITDLDGNVVARPFPKFFNLGEHTNPDQPAINWRLGYTVTEKVDGSLGIGYLVNGKLRIATRGSFVSEQAVMAMEIAKRRGYDKFIYPRQYTFLWEIVYKENRIVVDYGHMRDLILLDIIPLDRFDYHPPYSDLVDYAALIGCPVVNRLHFEELNEQNLAAHCAKSTPNTEGIVVRFDDGLRIKVKTAEYCRLHKLLTGISNVTIWDILKSGKLLDELLEVVPDEFNAWVRATSHTIHQNYAIISLKVFGRFRELKQALPADATRKTWAEEILKTPDISAALFKLLDGKDPDDLLWKSCKPDRVRAFKTEDV